MKINYLIHLGENLLCGGLLVPVLGLLSGQQGLQLSQPLSLLIHLIPAHTHTGYRQTVCGVHPEG